MAVDRARALRGVGLVVGLGLAALVIARCRGEGPAKGAAASASSSAQLAARPAARPRTAEPPPGAVVAAEPVGPPVPTFSPDFPREDRAKYTLDSYLAWARYPPTSRPARERPDRQKPHSVPARRLPLSKSDRSGSGVSLVLSQSHYFLGGDEAATLTVSCRRGDEPAPCTVTSALAEAAPDAAGRAEGTAAVAFVDDGSGSDRAANDGVWTATFAPGKVGFQKLHGPIVVTVSVDAEGERGGADFQLSYTGAPPAIFTGAVREALEKGSLSLCVEMQVAEAGRYVLDGRVDDADGKTFAFVSYNDPIAAGKQEACFTVFGKLILDEGARSPFTLRDVEGFLLLEDAFPDRKTVPTLEGPVHKTRAYAASDFSSDEWQSPVKDRYVAKLKKDADGAE
jgi:hypothetical protein